MLKIPVHFLSGVEGDGYMLLHDVTRAVLSVHTNDDAVVPDQQPYSYYCTGDAVFVEPEMVVDSPAQTPVETVLTVLAFRNLFTMQEKAAVYDLAKTNSLVAAWLDDLASAESVNLAHQQTIDSVNGLAALGAITPERAAEVLGA